ncbi:retrovirus-related pol polyprotein from transposon TNT 1-94, partial [Tanacetum coccineum]
MGWVVQSDAVWRSCDAVLRWVVTASRVVYDAVSRVEILKRCWCRDTLKDSGESADKSIEELQVEVELQREPRTRTKPLRFQDESNIVAYVFVVAEEEDTHEPLTYQEAVACEDSSKWKAAMKEEMDSLRKNKTWELVDHPARSYSPGEYIYLLLYIDDMLIACKSKAKIGSTKTLLKRELDMKELGEANKILGMEIIRDQSCKILRVSQSGYVSKILNNFRIDNGKSVQMPLGRHFKLSLKDC